MAVYKRDIVDINLETGNIHRSFLKHSIGYKDAAADHFGIRVFRNGEPVSLTGVSVQGIFMPPQGDPIAITSGNIVSENEAEVVLPQACYNYDGQFTLSIKLVDATNAVTGTMRIVDGMVDNTHASGTVAPTDTVPSYQEILAVYAQLLEDVTDYESVVATQDAKIDDLKSALTSAEQTIVKCTFHAENVESGFTFSTGDINTNTGAKVSTDYAAITGYKGPFDNVYFGMTTDDYYYRIAYTNTRQTSTGNVKYITDYVKGTTKTNLKFGDTVGLKIIVVKDLTGTISMADKLTDVQSKCRYYIATPYQLDATLTQSGMAADAAKCGEIKKVTEPFVEDMPFVKELYFFDKQTYSGIILNDMYALPQDNQYRIRFSKNGSYVADTSVLTDADNLYGILPLYAYGHTTEILGYILFDWDAYINKGVIFTQKSVSNLAFDLAFSPSIYNYLSGSTKNEINVACIGDSLTAGIITNNTSTTKNYPYWLTRLYGYRTKNYGIPGASCKSWWDDVVVNQYHSEFVFDSSIDSVIIFLGTNGGVGVHNEDDTTFLPDPPYYPNTLSAFRTSYPTYNDYPSGEHDQTAYLCRIIEYVWQQCGYDTQIVLCIPPSPDPFNADMTSKTKTIMNSEPIIRKIASFYRVPVIDLLNDFGPNFITASTIHSSDGLHYTEAGYKLIGAFIANQFTSYVDQTSMD